MTSIEQIQIAPMQQLKEAISKQDDWTGTKDAAARRRAQTRLNTRAYRKRKALAKKAEAAGAGDIVPVKSESLVDCWDLGLESVAVVPASRAQQLYNSKSRLIPDRTHGSKRNSKQLKIVFPLCSDHLITLQQLNALRAMAVNRTLFSGILTTVLECEVELIHTVPYPAKPETLPPTLLSTLLQQTVPHGDWIDMFPSAESRDRLIQAAGTFNEDDLWSDCVGGLFEGYPDDEIERRGIIAWSPPWDISGWEMTEGFIKKWGWIVRGIPGALEATNRWRRERGQDPLAWDD